MVFGAEYLFIMDYVISEKKKIDIFLTEKYSRKHLGNSLVVRKNWISDEDRLIRRLDD